MELKRKYMKNNRQYSKRFYKIQGSPYRKFKDYENYDDMRPVRNQSAKLYGTAKTHKIKNLEDIIQLHHKCCPIIDQMRTFTYKAEL